MKLAVVAITDGGAILARRIAIIGFFLLLTSYCLLRTSFSYFLTTTL